MSDKLNLFQRMAYISNSLGMVAKNLNVSTGSSSYKAVSEVDIINAVKPLEFQYGVYSYPESREIIKDEIIKKTKTYKGETTETTNLFIRVKVVYRFINVDEPSESLTIISYGDGVDSQDKAPGKAMTYADKYALMKAYKIATGDDPDAQASEENFHKQEEPKKAKSEPKPEEFVPCTAEQYQFLMVSASKITPTWLEQKFGVDSLAKLSYTQADTLIKAITAKQNGKVAN